MRQEQIRNLRRDISNVYDSLAWKRDEDKLHESENSPNFGEIKQNLFNILVELDNSLQEDF